MRTRKKSKSKRINIKSISHVVYEHDEETDEMIFKSEKKLYEKDKASSLNLVAKVSEKESD